MNYREEMRRIADQIIGQCDAIGGLENNRKNWVNPETERVKIGSTYYYVVRKDGSVMPGLEGIQAEMLKVIDDQLSKARSKLEGLRFQLVKLGKKGGAA